MSSFSHNNLPGAKPYKVVVRGMPESVPSLLMDQLTAEYGLKPVAVYPIKRREGVYRDTQYLLYFPAGTITLKQLKEEVKTVSSVVVTWDRYRPKKRAVTMCQNFGHGTRHCHRASRCGFCSMEASIPRMDASKRTRRMLRQPVPTVVANIEQRAGAVRSVRNA